VELGPVIDRVQGGANGSRVCNAWLVDGLLVDPSGDPWGRTPDFWRVYCREHDVQAIALTHWHADHATGVAALARELALPLFAPPIKRERVFSCVTEGERILDRFQVLSTPGHDDEHVSFWDERERTLIAGDAFEPSPGGHIDPLTISKIETLRPARILPGHGQEKV
jgi:glyoxylase-like metal-dependent hydrolase (beta-lactamase superfamily II)